MYSSVLQLSSVAGQHMGTSYIFTYLSPSPDRLNQQVWVGSHRIVLYLTRLQVALRQAEV